jgi:DNA-binding MarR family transcriptional regulator
VLAERGPLRVGDLAASLAVDETTATRLADRLERIGVAERRRTEDDRRATTVALTRAGERLQGEIDARRQEVFAEVLEALEPDERSELVRLTAKATAALREGIGTR